MFVSFTNCGEEALARFSLNFELVDKGWVNHCYDGARVDQTIRSNTPSIVARDLERNNL